MKMKMIKLRLSYIDYVSEKSYRSKFNEINCNKVSFQVLKKLKNFLKYLWNFAIY